MNGEKLWKALGDIDDRYLDMVDALEQERLDMKYEKKHTRARRTVTVLIAAALAVSLLTVTAFAAGWVPGIFRAMKEKAPEDENLYEAAAQANSEATPEQVEITEMPELELSNFTLFERYYDGKTILLGYDLNAVLPETVVGYKPDAVTLEKIRSGTSFEVEESDKAKGPTDVAVILDHILFGKLPPDAYEKAWRNLEEDGYVCIAYHDVWVGDHILVNGADIFEVIGPDVWNMRYDYQVEEGSCIKLNPLPEAGRNQSEVTVTLDIRSCESYYYLDLQGNAYTSSGNHQNQTLEFTLENVNQK